MSVWKFWKISGALTYTDNQGQRHAVRVKFECRGENIETALYDADVQLKAWIATRAGENWKMTWSYIRLTDIAREDDVG